MKFLIAVAAICMAGLVIAQQAQPVDQGRLVAEILATRGEVLLNNSRATIQNLYKEGKGHLASAVEHQVVLVEALVVDLKAQVANISKTHAVHHLHVIEEELLHLENRIGEELYIITHIGDDHTQQHQNGSDTTTAKLVAHAQSVIHQAQEALKAHPNSREASSIKAEIAAIEKLVVAIQAHPSPAEFKQEAQQLARHEQTLAQLVERANHTRQGQPLHPANPPATHFGHPTTPSSQPSSEIGRAHV